MTLFTVLFTAQKTKKQKTWHDGTLRCTSDGHKVQLLDEHGRTIDNGFLSAPQHDLAVDNVFELERHLVMVASLSAPPPPSWVTDPGAQSPATQSPPSTQPKRKQRVGWRQGDQHDAPDETPHGEDDSDSPKKPAVPTVHQPPPPQRRRPFRPPSLVRPPTAAAVPTPAPPPPPPQQEKARPSEARLFDLPWAGSTVVVRPAQAQQPPAAEPIVPEGSGSSGSSLLLSALLKRAAGASVSPLPQLQPPVQQQPKSVWSLYGDATAEQAHGDDDDDLMLSELNNDPAVWSQLSASPTTPHRSVAGSVLQATEDPSSQRPPGLSLFDLEGSASATASPLPSRSSNDRRAAAMMKGTDGDDDSEVYKKMQRRIQQRQRRNDKKAGANDDPEEEEQEQHETNQRASAAAVTAAPVVGSFRSSSKVAQMNALRRKRLLEEDDGGSTTTGITGNENTPPASSSKRPTKFPSAFSSSHRKPSRFDEYDEPSPSSIFGIVRDPTPSQNVVGVSLAFPGGTEVEDQRSKAIKRTADLPVVFENATQYKTLFGEALHENLQVQVTQLAITYHTLRAEWAQKHDGATRAPDGKTHEDFFRFKGVNLYVESTLSEIDNQYKRAGVTKLQLLVKRKQRSSMYNKDDLWVVSADEHFGPGLTFLARSTFFGPSASGFVEMMLLNNKDKHVAETLMRRPSVCAIHVVEAGSEFLMQETLNQHVDEMPLLDELLKPAASAGTSLRGSTGSSIAVLAYHTVMDLANEVTAEFRLNADQEAVLHDFALGFVEHRSLLGVAFTKAPSGVTLVHGVFGAGKSFLLAVLIIFLSRLRDKLPPAKARLFRVLVSSATNVAVDRVLRCLMDLGYTEFVRVGSLKKIAKCILPYTANGRNNEDVKELQMMLKGRDVSPQDEMYMRKTLENLKGDAKKDAVLKALVVGVTCNASSFPVMDGLSFPIVLLDECSQMVEPMSLVPVARFACVRLVLIGDPQQLSPTIPSDSTSENGLDRTLFERLRDGGHEAIMLGIQYRCHPTISNVCNDLFYGNQLRNGIATGQRTPLVDPLGPLTFVNVDNSTERYHGSSWYNDGEITTMMAAVKQLIRLGIPPDQIGVISLYKAQTIKISERLEQVTGGAGIQVSTVDAFQGAEKEVVLVSCVRTRSQQHDFIDSQRRINVAISRAKRHLIVVGHSDMLTKNNTWSRVLEHCRAHGRVVQHDSFSYEINEWAPGPGLPEVLPKPTGGSASSSSVAIDLLDDSADDGFD